MVHIFGHGYGGGFVLSQVVALRERGHFVMVVCPEEGPLTLRLREENVPVAIIRFRGYRLPDIPRIVRALWELTRLLRRTKPDVVHYHLMKAILVGRVAALLAGVPVRVSQLGGPLPLEIAPLRYLDFMTAWIDSAILAPAKCIEETYRRYLHTRGKVTLQYYGMNCSVFRPDVNRDVNKIKATVGIREDEKTVGMVAYMYPSRLKRFRDIGIKGHEVFIEAAGRVAKREERVKFLIVGDELTGDGSYRRKLEGMVSELGLEDTVLFTGYRPDIPDLLAVMDVVAVPSLSENLGGAVEPLLMEKPVVANNVGGLPDVVIDGETGLLVPPGDPESLARGILKLLALPESTRRKMGATGRKMVLETFDLEKTVDQLQLVYFGCCSGRERR